jgi:hypothetical protein
MHKHQGPGVSPALSVIGSAGLSAPRTRPERAALQESKNPGSRAIVVVNLYAQPDVLPQLTHL